MAKSNQHDGFLTQQPCDWFEDKVKFPCLVQAKIDGVASYNRHGVLLGRSLKPHENRFITETWSIPELHGMCGEMTLAGRSVGEDLCRETSSVMRRHEGEPKLTWWLFDYCTEETKNLPYCDRYEILKEKVINLNDPELVSSLNIDIGLIPCVAVQSMQELLDFEEKVLNLGYEGVIIRNPNAPFKYGRCGKTFMGAWRIKRFIDAEIRVTEIEEGNTNLNEAKTNERGRTERSSHKENLVPNGMVGNIKGILLKDIIDPQSKKVLTTAGEVVTVAPGEMTHEQRKFYFDNPQEIIGKIVKFKLFPKGIKELPRFPRFISIRNENDI